MLMKTQSQTTWKNARRTIIKKRNDFNCVAEPGITTDTIYVKKLWYSRMEVSITGSALLESACNEEAVERYIGVEAEL